MSRLTVSGEGKNGWSLNGVPGYQFKNKNGVAGFMLPGNEASWVPAKGEPIKNLKGLDTDNSRLKDDPKVINKDPFAPTILPTVSTRDNPAPNGGDGSGTQMSPGGTPILDAADAARFLNNLQIGTGQFSSTQLPMTQSSMWEKGSVDAQAFSGLEPSYTSNTLGSYTASPKAFANLDATGTGSEFNLNASVIPDAALRIGQATGAIPTASPISSGRLADALNDQAGMQSYMSKFGDADADMQRRANAAFLNTEGSMKGLRAKEAELSMFYAGGQHLSLNGDGSEFLRNKDGKNIAAANPDDVRNYKSGKMTAEQFRDTFKGAVNQTFTSAKDSESSHSKNPVAASYQSPNTNFGPVMDTEEMGKRLDASIGMNGTFGPVNDGDVYASFLDGRREPLARLLK